RNTRLQAGESLNVDTLVGGGNVQLTSLHGDLTAGDLAAGGEIKLRAARQLTVGTAESGQDLVAASGGDQQWGDYSAGDDAFLTRVGSNVIGLGRAHSEQQIIAEGSVAFDTLQAGRAIWNDARDGDVTGAMMEASSADVGASN